MAAKGDHHGVPKQHYQPPPPDQVLASLKAKLSTCKPDFKGHLGPAAKNKTQQTVEREIAAERRKLAGEGPFRPFQRGKIVVALDGTKVGKVLPHHSNHDEQHGEQAASTRVELPPEHHNRNKYKQELDPATGKPVLSTVLTWTGDELPTNVNSQRRTGRRAFPEKMDITNPLETEDSTRFRVRATRQDVEDLTPRHRTTLIRQITLTNPKFTADTRVEHATKHWDPMTQLLAHAFVEPEKKVKKTPTPRAAEKNSVRLVALMRRSQSARAWR